jgi:putative ABC transport system permease protein
VRRELNGLIADLPQAFPGDLLALANGDEIKLASTARTLQESTVGSVARGLWILLGSVGLVLLVACANVANLFLVRSEARQREVAVRRALGAGQLGIARSFLAESLLLSMAGGGLGIALAWTAVHMLVAFGPASLPRLGEVQLDGYVLAFAFGTSLLAALAFGVIPLWHGPSLLALQESGRSNTASRSRQRARQLLMGGQVALALVLLVSSGLMVRSFQKLRSLDPGFDAASALTFSIGLPERDYRTRDEAVAAHQTILDRLAALPGVTAVSASTCLPLAGTCSGNTVRVEGRTYPPGTIPPLAFLRAVAGGYFETLRFRVIRGRTLDRRDVDGREPVAVINQALADILFPKQEPIGQRVASNRPPARPGERPDLTWLTIVGVVANTPTRALAEVPAGQLFLPMSLASERGGAVRLGPDVAAMSYVVRAPTSLPALLPAVRRTIDGVNAELAVAQAETMQVALDRASAQMAFTMTLLAIAAGVALVLGVIGIYGVMSYLVSQRTGEIGVRLALGAEPSSVAGMIVRQGGLVALAGIVVGLAVAFAGSRVIESLLYGVSPRDPIVFASTTLVLIAVALLACWFPARRAARLDPLAALRAD